MRTEAFLTAMEKIKEEPETSEHVIAAIMKNDLLSYDDLLKCKKAAEKQENVTIMAYIMHALGKFENTEPDMDI